MKNYTAKKSSKTKYPIIKKFPIALWICLFSSSISYAQLSHEFHLGFSALRIWNINPPVMMNPTDPMVTSLDNYFSPHIGYDLHFNENNFIIGFRLGATYEEGNSSREFDEIKITSEDLRNSYFGEIRFGYNLLNLNSSYIQLAGGLRLGQIYYHKLEGDFNGWWNFKAEATDARIPTLDYVLAIAYQYNFNRKKLFQKHHLGIRVSLDMLYMRPRQNFGSDYRRYSSIALGPSVSLVWRINNKRSGLY